MKKINVWCIVVTVLFLLLGLSKAALASSQGKAKKDPDIDGTYVSSVLNDINAITFTTQYQLQLDLINGIAYTKSEIDDVINRRDLLTPALYKKPLRNDDYEQLLAHALIETTEDGEEVESILPDRNIS